MTTEGVRRLFAYTGITMTCRTAPCRLTYKIASSVRGVAVLNDSLCSINDARVASSDIGGAHGHARLYFFGATPNLSPRWKKKSPRIRIVRHRLTKADR